jgi:hypothetical protein
MEGTDHIQASQNPLGIFYGISRRVCRLFKSSATILWRIRNMSQHHPSCLPSDRDLVWLCAQCGGHESAESILDERKILVDALKELQVALITGRLPESLLKICRDALANVKP